MAKRLFLIIGLALLLILGVFLNLPAPTIPEARPYMQSVPLHPQARATLREFQLAIRDSNWEAALGLCTEAAKNAAIEYSSSEDFLTGIIPIDEFIGSHRFRVRPKKHSGKSRINVTSYEWSVSIRHRDDPYGYELRYGLLKQNDVWQIELPRVPFLERIDTFRIRRQEAEERLRNVGREMLAESKASEDVERFEHMLNDPNFQIEQQLRESSRLQEKNRRANLQTDHINRLVPKLSGIQLKLDAVNDSFQIDKPMLFRLRLLNKGDSTLYYRFEMQDGSLTILDSKGDIVTYEGRFFHDEASFKPIEANGAVVLFDNYDVSARYFVDRPGKYTVEFNGSGLAIDDKPEATTDNMAIFNEIELISNTEAFEVMPR